MLTITGALVVGKRIVKPLEQLAKRINSQLKGGAAFTMDESYRTGDEIEILAEAFADLVKRTRDYIQEIITSTAEKKRIGTELAFATRIAGCLARIGCSTRWISRPTPHRRRY